MAIEKRKPEKALTSWRPTREIEELGQHFEDVFGRPFLPDLWNRFPAEDTIWAPSLDVIEQEDKFAIKVELPGVKEEDINIYVSGNTLTIEGVKEKESEVKRKGYYYSESSYGSFSRSITMPSSVDTSKIEANCENGILELSLPKMAEIKPKKVAVTKKAISPKKETK